MNEARSKGDRLENQLAIVLAPRRDDWPVLASFGSTDPIPVFGLLFTLQSSVCQATIRSCPPPVFRVPECKGSLESMEPKRLTRTTATDEVVGRSGGSCGCPAAGGPSTPGAPGGSFGEPYVGDQPLCGLDGEFGEARWTALEDPASHGQ